MQFIPISNAIINPIHNSHAVRTSILSDWWTVPRDSHSELGLTVVWALEPFNANAWSLSHTTLGELTMLPNHNYNYAMALENPGKLSEFFSPTLWPLCLVVPSLGDGRTGKARNAVIRMAALCIIVNRQHFQRYLLIAGPLHCTIC